VAAVEEVEEVEEVERSGFLISPTAFRMLAFRTGILFSIVSTTLRLRRASS
jgi:hypothetical protein